MLSEKQMLVRMFFQNGHIETRPLDWVLFTTPQDITSEELRDAVNTIKEPNEKYVVFVNQLTAMQIFKGEYVNVRSERERDRQHQSQR